MQDFYKKALIAFISVLAANALLATLFIYLSYPSQTLLPAESGRAGWQYVPYSDVATGGSSSIRMHDLSRERMRFDYKLTDQSQYPYVSGQLVFQDAKGRQRLVDWSKFGTVSFVARCAPASSMAMFVSAFDDKVTKPDDPMTYRSPGEYFSCNEQGVRVSLDLSRLTQPDWWFHQMKLDLTSRRYKLDKVLKLNFGTSGTTPRNVDGYLEISELTLHGRDERYIVALAALVLASLLGCAWWFFRAHAHALRASMEASMKKDLPLVAYRQLTLEPYRDKEKATILRFIATNYTDPELDLECVVNQTGANRNKVNEVLKTELGMTFTSYLNKLRLTEAARLLSENNSAAVAEIAYTVGYANVSYFNKLFKEEYGCTPKAFRALSSQQEQPATQPATEAGADGAAAQG